VLAAADNLFAPRVSRNGFQGAAATNSSSRGGPVQSPRLFLSQRAFLQACYPKRIQLCVRRLRKRVGSLKLEDVHAYYEKVFRPDLTTIVVVGKVTPDQAQAVLKLFRCMASAGPKPETDLPPVARNRLAPPLYRTGAGSRMRCPLDNLRADTAAPRLLRAPAWPAGSFRRLLLPAGYIISSHQR